MPVPKAVPSWLVCLLGGTAGLYIGEDVELRERLVPGGRHLDLAGLDLELRLRKIRTAGERLIRSNQEIGGIVPGSPASMMWSVGTISVKAAAKTGSPVRRI